MNFPSYESIDLTKTNLKWGYYVPALIEQYRPDIRLIGIQVDLTEFCDPQGHVIRSYSQTDYSRLPQRIEQLLKANKKIGLLIEDEHVQPSRNEQMIDIVNYYRDRPIYWLSQNFQKNIESQYRNRHGLQCKILEFPWVIANECLVYDKAKSTTRSKTKMVQNKQNCFFALAGRFEPWRKHLFNKLIAHDLHRHGQLFVPQNPDLRHYHDIMSEITVDPNNPYADQPIKIHTKMAAQFLVNNIWHSCNTQNFLHMEQHYQNYPLAIIPETFFSDYFSTEKSVWPILLGKLFLIFGSAGCMKFIQRFYDLDMSEFLNLKFDDMEITNSDDIDIKLHCMIKYNKDFILNSHDVYAKHRRRIQAARNTLGPNIYQFLLHQIDQIQ